MKILIDENLPRKLADHLEGLEMPDSDGMRLVGEEER